MPASLKYLSIAVSLASVLLATGCGDEIGDTCSLSTDCSQNGDRFCDTLSPGGYCTIIGCDHQSCPEDATCVRFFSGTQTNVTCAIDADCTPDELCRLDGTCVPKSSEARFCMRSCSSDDDCRDKYECRTEELMKVNGGEPVREPGTPRPAKLQGFCAPSPISL